MINTATGALDTKGIKYFLLFTFGFTYPIVFIYYAKGYFLFGNHPLYATFPLAFSIFAPAVGAFLVNQYIVGETKPDDTLAVRNIKRYLKMYFLMPGLFLIVYGITILFVALPESWMVDVYDLGDPDNMIPYMKIPSYFIFTSAIITSLVTSPIVSSLHAFGQEYGFRGYLITKLLPLGRKKAIVISSAVWALWYGPYMLIGMHYNGNLFLGMLIWMVFIFFFGIFLGYLRLTSGTVILPCFAHGVFMAQLYGLMPSLFPNMNKHLGGMTGVPGLLIFGLLALWAITRNLEEQDQKDTEPKSAEPAPAEK